MLTFLINLDASVDRYQKMSRQLAKLSVPYARVSAINGRNLTIDQIEQLSYPITDKEIRVRYTRDLTLGEIGCFLSHRLCWKKLLDSSHKWALIMEDDIQISSNASYYMSSDEWLPEQVKICQLSCLQKTQEGRVGLEKLSCREVQLVNPIYPPPLGCQAYFISREFAQEAIRMSNKLPAPVDDFLFSPWFELSHKFKIWRTNPVLVVPISDVSSDIGDRSKKSVIKAPFYLRHGIKRFLLGRKIRKEQKKGEWFKFEYRDDF